MKIRRTIVAGFGLAFMIMFGLTGCEQSDSGTTIGVSGSGATQGAYQAQAVVGQRVYANGTNQLYVYVGDKLTRTDGGQMSTDGFAGLKFQQVNTGYTFTAQLQITGGASGSPSFNGTLHWSF